MRYKIFKNKYITGVCRDCLNQNSGLELTSRDCVHNRKGSRCPQCHDYRYVIVDLRRRGKMKVFFHKDKKQ